MSTPAKAAPSKARRTTARATPRSLVHVLAPSPRQLDDPELFINRELSLLDFQRRVLGEAQDGSNPLLERLMFLSFVGSNVDEFFMVRVAGLKRQIEKSVMDTGPDGMSAAEQLRAIRASVIRLYRGAHECWSKELVPALEGSGIRILSYANLTDEQRAVADSYFQEAVFPTLTPLAFDPGRPLPHISNLSLNLAVLLRAGEGEHFARVKIPDTLPQLVPVSVAPKAKGTGGLKRGLSGCVRPQSMYRIARRRPPMARSWLRSPSTAVALRSASPRTVSASEMAMVARAAESQRTARRAVPWAAFGCRG